MPKQPASSACLRLFTLIHVQADERSVHNATVTSLDEQLRLYVGCAQQLARSLRRAGVELAILTNDPPAIRNAGGQTDVPVVGIPCDFPVPSGIGFYSAHFKIDAFRYLAGLGAGYVGLVDADMICLNEVPQSLGNAIRQQLPLYFDITDQVTPAFGAAAIIADKARLCASDSLGLWAGGEFIAGPPAFFEMLYDECVRVSPPYFADFRSFCQQGDEMLASVAIETMIRRRAIPIMDAGALSVVARFWSVATRHVQQPIEAYRNHFLLHLPADKHLLSSLASRTVPRDDFFRLYDRHQRVTRLTAPFTALMRKMRTLRRRKQPNA